VPKNQMCNMKLKLSTWSTATIVQYSKASMALLVDLGTW